MTAIPPCKKCSSTYTIINSRIYGWERTRYDGNGQFYQLNDDGLRSVPSATIRCADCNKIRRDLETVEAGPNDYVPNDYHSTFRIIEKGE